MFISRKRWEALERKVADLEREVQDQPEEIMKEICQQWMSQMTKSNRPYRQDRKQRSEESCAERAFLLAAEPSSTKDEKGGEKMEQSREEMHEKIMKASDQKILRRQMELIAEYSRTCGIKRIPEASQAMVCVHKELVKTKYLFFVRVLVTFFAFLYFFKRFAVKRIKFVKG